MLRKLDSALNHSEKIHDNIGYCKAKLDDPIYDKYTNVLKVILDQNAALHEMVKQLKGQL